MSLDEARDVVKAAETGADNAQRAEDEARRAHRKQVEALTRDFLDRAHALDLPALTGLLPSEEPESVQKRGLFRRRDASPPASRAQSIAVWEVGQIKDSVSVGFGETLQGVSTLYLAEDGRYWSGAPRHQTQPAGPSEGAVQLVRQPTSDWYGETVPSVMWDFHGFPSELRKFVFEPTPDFAFGINPERNRYYERQVLTGLQVLLARHLP
ncbi:MAG: hypothetical protein JHC84_05350 [Solirubrobacteraceae bacterium]|nr:hypothetical protein [Solirubrobacteraceae bacterium]